MDKETMSVQELSTRMGISLPKAYALVKEPDFPLIVSAQGYSFPRTLSRNGSSSIHRRSRQ